ncbi:MAG TPA: C4-dicarboxylate ABC transporter substrate-binding protein, partial [Deltaproteobacteria bacterium]|nr:C4-dicarboxylate ABC transporter substrate-binding protein [Deltaproteobacteria bacterium]
MRSRRLFPVFLAVLLGFLLVSPTPPLQAEATITLTYANFPPAPTFPCVQME